MDIDDKQGWHWERSTIENSLIYDDTERAIVLQKRLIFMIIKRNN